MSANSTKVIIGMSGGVDSAVAALLLKEQGYNVEAVFMKNWEENDHNSVNGGNANVCTAAQDFADAQAVCDILQIPLHAVNFSHEYWQRVFQYMLDEYARGRTPNPDVMCNKEIKFKEFLNYAKTLGADSIATGHYARHVIDDNSNLDSTIANSASSSVHRLYKAFDHNKDQTYFIYSLTQSQLAFTLFPLGEIKKEQVRNLAKKSNLPNHAKKDSTGICFIGERKFKHFLSEYLLAKPGEIVTVEGEILGKHDGLMFYTLGQRQGLGIGGKKGASESPWYVVQKDMEHNRLVVDQNSHHHLLMTKTLYCEPIHWITEIDPQLPLKCSAKIRYRQDEQACEITPSAHSAQEFCVTFAEIQRAITPGQAVVFYLNEECLGGSTITSSSVLA